MFTLCALFIVYIPFTYDTFQFGNTLITSAYAQTPNPGDPGSTGNGNTSGPGNTPDPGSSGNSGGLGSSSGPDPSAGDNSANPSNPGAVSSGIGNGTNVMTQNDTSNVPDASTPVAPGDVSTPSSAFSAQVVPEFGPISLAILVISIMSILVISSRTRLRF